MALVIAEKQEALLGLRVMTHMHNAGLSIPQLAKRAHVPLSVVQKIVAGEGKRPSVWTVWALAEVLEVSMDYLCGRTDRKVVPPRAWSAATPGSRDWSPGDS
jgi:transcriptional regulator with XRE-family HTH domain